MLYIEQTVDGKGSKVLDVVLFSVKCPVRGKGSVCIAKVEGTRGVSAQLPGGNIGSEPTVGGMVTRMSWKSGGTAVGLQRQGDGVVFLHCRHMCETGVEAGGSVTIAKVPPHGCWVITAWGVVLVNVITSLDRW